MSREKKTYLTKITLNIVSLLIMFSLFFVTCNMSVNRCFWGDDIPFVMVTFHMSLSVFVISFLTFFISDKIFKKWLKFTFFYLLITAFLVYLAPVSAGGALGVGPTKELVSIWMGTLFVIISVVMFIWMSIKEKNKK